MVAILDSGGLDTHTHTHSTGTGTMSDVFTILPTHPPPCYLAQCLAKMALGLVMKLDLRIMFELDTHGLKG